MVHSNGNLAFQTYSRQMVKVLRQPLSTLAVSVSSVYVLERRPGNGHGEMWLTLLAPEPPRVVMELLQSNLPPLCNSLGKFFCVVSRIILFKIHIYILIQLMIIKIIFSRLKYSRLKLSRNINNQTHLCFLCYRLSYALFILFFYVLFILSYVFRHIIIKLSWD